MARCFYCDARMKPKVQAKPARLYSNHLEYRATDDHVFPRVTMPQRDEAWHKLNKVPCCRGCNGRKGSMHPLEWLAMLPHDSGRDRLADRLLRLGCSAEEVKAARTKRKEARDETL